MRAPASAIRCLARLFGRVFVRARQRKRPISRRDRRLINGLLCGLKTFRNPHLLIGLRRQPRISRRQALRGFDHRFDYCLRACPRAEQVVPKRVQLLRASLALQLHFVSAVVATRVRAAHARRAVQRLVHVSYQV